MSFSDPVPRARMEAPEEVACVCVIDDDAGMRDALGSLLRSHGFDVELFGDPDAFLSAGLPAGPCCLILDVRLKDRNGLDFQEQLTSMGFAIPVIMITGHGDVPMAVRGMRAGAIDFLPKPFSEDQLLSAIGGAIAKDRERRLEAAKTDALKLRYSHLTERERQVMGLVVTGLMNKQVAARLELSEITVKIHRGSVMRKMEAQSLADLVRMAELLEIRDPTIRRFNH